jgi:hypothetical protein
MSWYGHVAPSRAGCTLSHPFRRRFYVRGSYSIYLRQPADRISGLRGPQEVERGGQQHGGLDGTVTGIRNALHDRQVLERILRLETHRCPVLAALQDMGGHVRQGESCLSRQRLPGLCGVAGWRAIQRIVTILWHARGLERMQIINLQAHAILVVGNG